MDGVITKKWLYQNQLNPVTELNANDSVITRYIYGTRANVPDYMIKDGNTYRVISDHLGSVRLIVNILDGSVEQRIDYNEYGNIVSNLGSLVSDLTYAGGLFDEHTGLIRFGARDYDPPTGRWTAKDPILFAGGQSNLYEYVLNDPINRLDIFGLQSLNNLKLHSTGIWKGSYNKLIGSFWQIVFIKVTNLNVLGTTVEISPLNRLMSPQRTVLAPKILPTSELLPNDSHIFKFYSFGDVPQGWEFDISTISDVQIIKYEIYSDLVTPIEPCK